MRHDQHLLTRATRAIADVRDELHDRILLWRDPVAPALLDEVVSTAIAVREGEAQLIELSAVQVLLDTALEDEQVDRNADDDATLYVCRKTIQRWVEHLHTHLATAG